MSAKLKPVSTEKAVMGIESENVITFITNLKDDKNSIKKEVEEMFEVKVDEVRTSIKNNKKYAYIKLNKDTPALDLATKLGLI